MRPSHALVLALSLAVAPAAAQQPVSLRDFAFLDGRWTGTLEYLDYADNRTRQTLEALLECAVTDTSIAYRFSYIEPNGKRVSMRSDVRHPEAVGGLFRQRSG